MPWQPTDVSGLRFWLHAAHSDHMWKESVQSIAATRSTADGDLVGQVDDLSPYAHLCRSLSAARRPLLSLGGGRNASLRFGATAIEYMVVNNSTTSFSHVYCGSPTFTIAFWVKRLANGVEGIICDSTNFTTANAGLHVSITTSNTVRFLTTKASAGVPVVDFTSTPTILVADGWVPVTITSNAGTGSLQIGANAPQAFSSAAGATAGTASYFSLNIGSRDGTDRFLNGHLSDLCIWDTVLDSTALTAFRAFDPAASSTTLAAQTTAGESIAADGLNFLHTWWDASDAATLWQDAAKTTPVAANSDPVGAMANKAPGGSASLRDALQATSGLRPLYKTAIANGKSALLFDGSDDVLGFAQWDIVGAQTCYFVLKNLDDTYGSHFIQGAGGSTPHWVLTGSSYAGNGGDGSARIALHMSDSSSALLSIDAGVVRLASAFQVLEVVRDGARWTTYLNGVVTADHPSIGVLAYNQFSRVGPTGGSISGDWWFDGYLCEYVRYNAAHSDASRDAVRQGLMQKWGVWPTVAPWQSTNGGVMVLPKNESGSYVFFSLESRRTGAALNSATAPVVTVFLDGGSGTTGAGTLTQLSSSRTWRYAPTQGETNATTALYRITHPDAATANVQVRFQPHRNGLPEVDVDTLSGSSVSTTGTVNFASEVGTSTLDQSDVETAVDAALAAYDPPTKAELDAGLAGLSIPTAAALADAVWEEPWADHVADETVGGLIRPYDATCQAGSEASSIVLAATASSVNDHYNDQKVSIVAGTGAGQSRRITNYVGASRVAAVDRPWAAGGTPDDASKYRIGEMAPGGAVDSVTGDVGGNVVGSVASVTAGVTLADNAITAAKIAADAITAAKFDTIAINPNGEFLEKLAALISTQIPPAGGSITIPFGGNGNRVVKGAAAATLFTQAVTRDPDADETLGPAS